jgi:hypothetical protein
MQNIWKRNGFGIIAGACFAALAALTLSGCSYLNSASTTTIPINLKVAQAEAQGILTAVEALAAAAPQSQTLTTAVGDAKLAVADFQALPPNGTYLAEAQAVIKDLQPALALLPIAGPTLVAVEGGMALLNGLVGGLAAVTVATPTTPAAVGAAPGQVIGAPIPIPIPAA